MLRSTSEEPPQQVSHLVSLYDYVAGETELDDVGDVWTVAPHVSMHLMFKKGDIFKLIGDIDWWIYVTSSSGKTGYVPSVFMAPLKDGCLNPELRQILSHRGDVPSSAIDVGADMKYFPDALVDNDDAQRERCPEESANIFSLLTFWWMTRLIWTGYRRPLVFRDLWTLKKIISSKEVVSIFDKCWEREKEKCANKSKERPRPQSPVKTNEARADELQELHDQHVTFSSDERKKVIEPSLIKVLFKAFLPYILPGCFAKLVFDILMFVQPQFLGAIVDYIEDEEGKSLWEGLLYAVAMFGVATIQTIVLQFYFTRVMVTGLRVRSAVYGAIYRKALVLSTSVRNKSTVGEMVNLMSVDAQHLTNIMTYLNMVWSAPLQIILSLVFLYRAMGVSFLAGVAVMVVLFPVNYLTGRTLRRFQVKQMRVKDSRIKLMNEILNGVKVLKLFAWETSFIAKILEFRQQEVRVLRLASYIAAAFRYLWTSAVPFLASLAMFGTYVLLGNNLTASKTFVALALINIIRFPLSVLATLLTNVIQAVVSAKRLQTFLDMEELDPNHVQRKTKTSEDSAVLRITNGTFSWEPDCKPTLEHIDLSVERGRLVAVVGQVGCGKSSLLSALLGEIRKLEGTVYREGSLAYVPQQAWIQNATLRENVLLGKLYDPQFYQKVINNCCLVPDLEVLPGGDMTEIGEKGINLSGGQKQRVSLARAVYSNADVYLLDDPLSAVDSHVGKALFDNMLGPNGMLKEKTRVLVTHQVRFLPQVDRIIVLKDGCISEAGSYSELLENNRDFAEFLRTYAKEHEDESNKSNMAKQRSLSHLSSARSHHSLSRTASMTSLASETSHDELLLTKQERRAQEDNKIIEQERAETGRVEFDVFVYYFASCGTLFILITVFLYLVSAVSISGSHLWLAHWSTVNITGNGQHNYYIGVYAALGLGQGVFLCLGGFTLAYLAVQASVVLHQNILDNILRLPMSFFETTPLGRIMNRFSKDIDVVDSNLPRALADFLGHFVSVLGTLFIISYSTPIFLAVLFPLTTLYFCIQRLYVATSRQLKRLESVSRSPIFSHFFETINGVSTIRAFDVQQQFIALSDEKVDETQMASYPTIMCNRWLAVRLEFIGNCIIFFTALLGVLARDNIESGLVGLSITVALSITQSLNWIVRMTSELETHIVSVERIKEYTEVKQEASWTSSKRPPDDWPEKGEIEITNLGVRYREGLDLALKHVNCSIYENEKIGIVGRTGSGKSTFALSLFRVMEAASGSIVIDDVNIADIGLHDLRSRITIIPQDPILFSASLRFNLDPFDKHSDEEVWTALEVAHLKSFVAGLNGTLNYLIYEGGENLSVGQRQLMCLARALLRRSKILILDEATAAVDLEFDELIQQTIRKEFAECTVLTIAHRLNTVMDYTRIIVLSGGEVIEFDAPKTLLANKGAFYEMAKHSNLVT